MKFLSRIVALMLLISTLLICSCEKERSCEDCITDPPGNNNINKPPVASAGQDLTVILPANSVLLDGSVSHDPDGSITAWSWTKISGPASVVLVDPNINKTRVNNLAEGIYLFELKITDNQSATAKDTVKVTVQPEMATEVPDFQGLTIYIAGQNLNENAAVWKNGQIRTLPDNGLSSWALSVCASGPDFYIAGIEPNASLLGANGLYWKNGNLLTLGGWGTSVFASANDVYYAGGSLYKNGIEQNVGAFWPYYVFASGNDLYLAGYDPAGSGAALWKNGSVQPLGQWDPSSLYVSGTNVFVSGVVNNTTAVLWKNGVLETLGKGGAASVFVSGNDVYVAGTKNGEATLWKNGQATSYGAGNANSVFVFNNDVYMVGNTIDGAVLWKNGREYRLAGLKSATSIFVQ